MAYKKDQGRYARMSAFWALFLLMADGCLNGLLIQLRNWAPSALGSDWIESLPLLGEVDGAKVLALVALAGSGFLIHRILNRPKVADLLIETEAELKKVTWPSAAETWTGSIAVVLTVTVLLAYLFAADAVLAYVLPKLMGGSA